jgi:hypothetical protein
MNFFIKHYSSVCYSQCTKGRKVKFIAVFNEAAPRYENACSSTSEILHTHTRSHGKMADQKERRQLEA